MTYSYIGWIAGDLENRAIMLRPVYSESALRSTQKGWGIGLAAVHSLAQEMNGTVRVESSKTQGTKITLSLPLRLDPGG
jgi:chemotaxis protein histidine kinase CheA